MSGTEIVAQPPADGSPLPVMSGTFALYEDGKGGFVLVTDMAGTVQRKHIPAGLVKMAMGDGAMSKRLRAMMGG